MREIIFPESFNYANYVMYIVTLFRCVMNVWNECCELSLALSRCSVFVCTMGCEREKKGGRCKERCSL